MSVTFIIFVALAIILSGYSRRKQALAAQFVHESDESGTSFEQFSDDEAAEKGTPSYFTYESDAPAPQPPVYRPTVRSQEPVSPVQPIQAEPVQFDLRQAVVAQVILNNPYNSEVN